ncbi:hypothetical protein MG293_005229 [Ovis ammon polii]|uniref:Uncharacterized protein n=2 Tax=Ovis TaxID=9935 RepID=A0AAD4YEG7_OVIAM|nr:hypothetical protein MG293_005229 [Ovis ammon polii]
MVFAKLEGFANRNLENLGAIICGNKKNKTYCESENTNICGNTHEKRLQSTLYRHAKKVSSTILKALQTELNMNLPDLETCINLIGQLKVFTLLQSHLCDIPHADDEPFAQTSVQSLDKTVDPLVSEADVTIVADDVVRTIFRKLYSTAMTDRNESENRYNTVTFPADISFPKPTRGGKSPVYSTILDRNPCTLQSTFNIGKLTKINVVKDIIQPILTNLEALATSKVKALFCPHISFTVPLALPSQQDEIALQQSWLSNKDSHSEDQFSSCTMDHSKSGKTTSICQLSASKLNMYATEVARQILQGIKHKLYQDIRSPFLTQSVVAFESIPSQVVSTVLDIVSTKGKYEINVFDRETDPVAPEDIIEKLFNKSDYCKKLQFQILETIEDILIDICEETIDENNL